MRWVVWFVTFTAIGWLLWYVGAGFYVGVVFGALGVCALDVILDEGWS